MFKNIEWTGKYLKIIDQTQIPQQLVYKELKSSEDVFEAIRKLRVRGAPAIGVAAAFGLYLGMLDIKWTDKSSFIKQAQTVANYLTSARPTAVNLSWALQHIINQIKITDADSNDLLKEILNIAQQIQRDDEERCRKIGIHGADLLENDMKVLTHCNTGALATAGIGTALGVIFTAHQQGKKLSVFVDETRPLLQGARLNMWELQQAGIPATLISDNMAAYAMQKEKVDLVIVGADRITANGDVANKIGTYNLAVNCHYHKIPFYVAAPLSTFDFSLSSGSEISIEERNCDEITKIWDQLSITIKDAQCWNPAFDITPSHLVTGIITEDGIFSQPYMQTLNKLNNKTHQNYKELSV